MRDLYRKIISAQRRVLRYYERGMVLQVENLAGKDSPAVVSEDLLYGKVADPIAACVGAYTLLRLGELDRLHEWTENLKNWFDWLPDGLAIRAEHLARRGQHAQALENLLFKTPSLFVDVLGV